jgi:hypothetical protein
VPRATTGRQDASLFQLSGDGTHTGEPLGPQVIHDGSKVGRTLLCVCLDGSHGLLVANLLASKRPCAVRIAKHHSVMSASPPKADIAEYWWDVR